MQRQQSRGLQLDIYFWASISGTQSTLTPSRTPAHECSTRTQRALCWQQEAKLFCTTAPTTPDLGTSHIVPGAENRKKELGVMRPIQPHPVLCPHPTLSPFFPSNPNLGSPLLLSFVPLSGVPKMELHCFLGKACMAKTDARSFHDAWLL